MRYRRLSLCENDRHIPQTWGAYIIPSVFTNSTVRVQQGQVNEGINIRPLNPHFDE